MEVATLAKLGMTSHWLASPIGAIVLLRMSEFKVSLSTYIHISSYYYNIYVCVHVVPTPNVSVRGHLRPYNGTVFNLTGEIQLDLGVVNTDITVIWVWSLGGELLETQTTASSSPHQITLIFQPLASDSSGEYILTVTIRPLDNFPFIVENNGSTTYNLVVQCKLGMNDNSFIS